MLKPHPFFSAFESLPKDPQYLIFNYLKLIDLYNLKNTSKTSQKTVNKYHKLERVKSILDERYRNILDTSLGEGKRVTDLAKFFEFSVPECPQYSPLIRFCSADGLKVLAALMTYTPDLKTALDNLINFLKENKIGRQYLEPIILSAGIDFPAFFNINADFAEKRNNDAYKVLTLRKSVALIEKIIRSPHKMSNETMRKMLTEVGEKVLKLLEKNKSKVDWSDEIWACMLTEEGLEVIEKKLINIEEIGYRSPHELEILLTQRGLVYLKEKQRLKKRPFDPSSFDKFKFSFAREKKAVDKGYIKFPTQSITDLFYYGDNDFWKHHQNNLSGFESKVGKLFEQEFSYNAMEIFLDLKITLEKKTFGSFFNKKEDLLDRKILNLKGKVYPDEMTADKLAKYKQLYNLNGLALILEKHISHTQICSTDKKTLELLVSDSGAELILKGVFKVDELKAIPDLDLFLKYFKEGKITLADLTGDRPKFSFELIKKLSTPLGLEFLSGEPRLIDKILGFSNPERFITKHGYELLTKELTKLITLSLPALNKGLQEGFEKPEHTRTFS